MAGLFGIAVIHTKSRIGGALATIGWCVAACVFGYLELSKRADGVVFLTVQTPKWVYYMVVGSVGVFNVIVVVKALSRRVMARKQQTTETTEKPPQDSAPLS